MKTSLLFADGVGWLDGPFLTTLPGRLSGWGAGGFRTGAGPPARAPGASLRTGFRRVLSDGVSVCAPVRASGRGFGERCCLGFGRRGEKIRAAPFFDPIKRYFCREGCARDGIVCLFAGCRSAGMRRESSAGHGPFAPACGGARKFRGARAFCAGMRRGRGVPRSTGLLRRHAAGQGSSAGHGPFAPACGGAGKSPAELRTSSVQRHARGRALSGKTENRPKTEKNRESTENGKSTENREKQKIDRKQRIDGI